MDYIEMIARSRSRKGPTYDISDSICAKDRDFRLLCGQRVAKAVRITFTGRCVWIAAFLCFIVPPAQRTAAQAAPAVQEQSLPSSSTVAGADSPSTPPAPLFDFKDSDIKFNLQSLMDILRDKRHEGWVLAAYPDPNTHRPLIGAGFSLDLQATEHPQLDPLNPHPFLEPSSAQLWQAAGLDPALLQKILDRFDHDMSSWTLKQYRRKLRMHALAPELTEDEATRLLRISTIQAIYNAKAYCRNFDQFTGAQQMALSQLVFQMGVNLEEFVQFLGVLNGGEAQNAANGGNAFDPQHWRTVQTALIDSQWARRYRDRASTVIAMFDPDYSDDPYAAERRVDAVLHPPSRHRRGRHSARMVRTASSGTRSGRIPGKPAARKRASA